MIRNLKILGLAITAALATSVFWAASAQAAEPELHCTTSTNLCIITGTEINTHTFNVEGGNVRCRSSLGVTLNWKTTGNHIDGVIASYTGCRAFGVAANVNMEGCTYTFANVAFSSPATANVNVVCPEGKTIVVNAPTLPCTITVGPQNELAHVVFENSASRTEPTDVIAKFTVAGIRYTNTGVGCARTGTFNTGTYNGESTLEGFNNPFDVVNRTAIEGEKVGLHVKPL